MDPKIDMISNYILPIILFLAGQTIFFIVGFVNFYTRVMTRLRELEVRINMVERNEKEIFEKLDRLLESTHRIEVGLGNKKDRDP